MPLLTEKSRLTTIFTMFDPSRRQLHAIQAAVDSVNMNDRRRMVYSKLVAERKGSSTARRVPFRLICIICAVGLLPIASCSEGRSIAAYCTEVEKGATLLDERTSSTPKDAASQVEMIFLNIGDFTSLLNRLVNVAPEEIASDLELAANTWNQTADLAADAMDKPIRTLTKVLALSAMSAGAAKNVDQFTSDNCDGRVLFGTISSFENNDGTNHSGEEKGNSCEIAPEFAEIPDPWVPGWKLLDLVTGIPATAERALRAIDEGIQSLSPAPLTFGEAITRFSIETNTDHLTKLRVAMTTITDECGTSPLTEGDISDLESVRPRFGPEGLVVERTGAFGCDAGFVAAAQLLIECEPLIRRSLDLDTGAVHQIELAQSSNETPRSVMVSAGEPDTPQRMWWLVDELIPASGLQEPTQKLYLRSALLDGSDATSVLLATMPATGNPTWKYRLVGVTGSRAALIEPVPGTDADTIIVRDTQGHSLAALDASLNSSFQVAGGTGVQPPNGLVILQSPPRQIAVAIDSGQFEPTQSFSSMSTNICGDRALTAELQFQSGKSLSILSRQIDPAGNSSIFGDPIYTDISVRTGVAIADLDGDQFGPAGTIAGINPITRAVLWTIPPTVAKSVEIAGGWVRVTNTSGAAIFVDPTTGTEIADVPVAASRFANSLGAESASFGSPIEPIWFDRFDGTVGFLDELGGIINASFNSICPE